MKNVFYCLLLLISIGCSTSKKVATALEDDAGNLVGIATKNNFLQEPYSDWFNTNYKDYNLNATIIEQLKPHLKKVTIKAFMGTWCGDSKREVPKFYKVLEAANFSENKLRVVGLNNGSKQYKQGPNGEEKGLNIHRVPTFIVYNKKGKEVGRIVEHPVESLEADLLKICQGKSYEHKYQVVTQFDNILQKKGEAYIMENLEKVTSTLQPYSESLKELNTYGYVLLHAKAIEKAIAVFTVNTKLFPTDKNSFDSLAEAYFTANNYEKATTLYNKVLELDANDTNAKTMLAKMQR